MIDSLAIPDFLRREPEPPRRRHRKRIKIKSTKPAAARWREARPYVVEVPGDIRAIPPGRRLVYAIVGRKWVSLAYHQKRTRVLLTTWDALRNEAV